MYNQQSTERKRETKTNFYQNGNKKKRGRPEEEKLRQETGLPVYPSSLSDWTLVLPTHYTYYGIGYYKVSEC
jgi:hypothetical protein